MGAKWILPKYIHFGAHESSIFKRTWYGHLWYLFLNWQNFSLNLHWQPLENNIVQNRSTLRPLEQDIFLRAFDIRFGLYLLTGLMDLISTKFKIVVKTMNMDE